MRQGDRVLHVGEDVVKHHRATRVKTATETDLVVMERRVLRDPKTSQRLSEAHVGEGERTYTTLSEELTVFDWRWPSTKSFPSTMALKNAPTVPDYVRPDQFLGCPCRTRGKSRLTPIALRSLPVLSAGTETTPWNWTSADTSLAISPMIVFL